MRTVTLTELPTSDDLIEAAHRIGPRINRTPVLRSRRLDTETGAALFFKCENLQRTGAFKFRGASNAVGALTEAEAGSGVATHSSGNHGAALALAAAQRDIPCHVVVPEGAVPAKVAAIAEYGGRVHRCAPTQAAREQGLKDLVAATGAIPIPPYDDRRIIAGQGTAALELLDEVPALDLVLAPLGGGGLLSGCAVVAKSGAAALQVIGVEPAGADEARRSLSAGHIVTDQVPETIADGLRATIGPLTFAVISSLVDEVVTVTDEAIIRAMRDIWRMMRVVCEPSSATVLAAIRAHPDRFRGRRVGLVLSGGNVDLDHLPWR